MTHTLYARGARRSWPVGLAVVVGAVSLAGIPSAEPVRAAACQTAHQIDGAFRSVDKPDDLLPGPLVAHAVEPADPRTVYLADPTRVAVSTDAGCTWAPLLTVDAAGPTTTITALVVPDSPEPTGRLHVTVRDRVLGEVANGGRLLSRRGPGQEFVLAALPFAGPVLVAPAPGDPDVVYAVAAGLAGGTVAARSDDGGASFRPLPGIRRESAATPDVFTHRIGVDPERSSHAAVAGRGLAATDDGGLTFRTLLEGNQLRWTHGLAVHPAGGDSAGTTVVVGTGSLNTAVGPGSGAVYQVRRDGAVGELPRLGLEGVPESLAVGRDGDELVLATRDLGPNFPSGYTGPGALFLFDGPRGTWVDVMDGRGHPLLGAAVDRTLDPAVHLHSSSLSTPAGPDRYVVYDPPAAGRIVPPTVDDGTGAAVVDDGLFPPPPAACSDAPVLAPPPVRSPTAELTPSQTTLRPDAAGVGAQEYLLELSGAARALDLFVLLDTSDSMKSAADGLACGLQELVTALAGEGVDLRVGLGEFWDKSPERYRRLVDLASPGRELQRQLRTVTTRGGEEAHRSALYQAVTGEGLVVDGREVVRPDQAASFREDALRVVLHLTDEPWTPTTPGEPSEDAVISALRAAAVQHVGIQVAHRDGASRAGGDRLSGVEQHALLRVQLDRFSAGSGALAPAGGVDCDGDGTPDLRAGDPLVCLAVEQDGEVPVGAPVQALLRALDARGAVALRPSAPADLLEVTVAERYDEVDLRAGGTFSFTVAARCLGAADAPVTAKLEAIAGGAAVATAVAQMQCGTAGPPPADGPAGAQAAPSDAGPAAAVAAAPPAAPPPAVQVPAPVPLPAGAGAAAGAGAGAGAGAAAGAGGAVPGQVPGAVGHGSAGLAGAPQERARGQAEAYAGTSAQRDVPLAAVPLTGGAAAAAAATAHLLAQRRRSSVPVTAPAVGGRRRRRE
ncbi:MAG: hypothetical protein WD794_04500 [Mycobacteriales bacterium]